MNSVAGTFEVECDTHEVEYKMLDNDIYIENMEKLNQRNIILHRRHI